MPKAGSDFPCASNVTKKVVLTMMAYSTLSVLLLYKSLTYHPLHNGFLTTKDKFKAYFLVHPASASQQATVGCIH